MKRLTAMKYCLVIIFCFSIKNTGIAQKIAPFGTDKFGIKNIITGKVLIYPKYKRIVDYNDSLIIVQSDYYRFGVIDTLDKILVPFSSEELLFEKYDKEHLGQILEKSTIQNNLPVYYYIDRCRNCIPYDYYPCPKGKSLNDSIPLYLRLVQKGYDCLSDNKKDSALYFIDKAIDANPSNAFVYYARVSMCMMNSQGQFITNKDSLKQGELDAIISNLDKAYSLKTTTVNYLNILSLKRKVYQLYFKDPALIRSIDKESKKYKPVFVNSGWFLNTGVSYSNGLEVEIGLANGLLTRNEKFWPKPYSGNGILFLGGSYLKNLAQEVDGYKLYLLSLVKPINFSLCPIIYTDYKRTDWILRPEFGLGYESFSFSIGYNLFVKSEMYKELNSFSFNLRYYLPLSNNKSFAAR